MDESFERHIGQAINFALDPNKTVFFDILQGGSIGCHPLINDGIIYFTSCDGHIYALDFDANLLWKFKTMATTQPSPVNLTIKEERGGIVRYFQLPAPIGVIERAYKLVEEMRRGGYGIAGSGYDMADVYHFAERKYGREASGKFSALN